MQKFEDITHEYRVILVNGTVIAVVRKDKRRPRSTGSNFVVPTARETRVVGQVASQYCVDEDGESIEGVIGVDLALTRDQRVVVIEENRAPQWRRVQEVLGINIANRIFEEIGH